MSFFKTKKKVRLSEFCTEFYDKNFIEPIAGGINFSNTYNELIAEKITEKDKSFQEINFENFSNEILILRFELFSLAWFHQFDTKSAVTHSIFTKKYLDDNRREDLWDNAETYNQAIAESANYGYNPSTSSGKAGRLVIAMTRMDLFNKYYSDDIDGKCLARALNRYGTNSSWKKLSITLGYIAMSLCKNLNCSLIDDANFQLIAVLKGFYDGSKQSMEEIKIIE